MPVQDRLQVHEARDHWDVSDVGGPDLLGLINVPIAQQLGVNPMSGSSLAGSKARRDCMQAHHPPEPMDRLAINPIDSVDQLIAYPPGAVEWSLQVDLVDLAHQLRIFRTNRRCRLVGDRRSGDVQRAALGRLRQLVVFANHAFALADQSRPSALAKKSSTMVNAPILACSFSTSNALPSSSEPRPQRRLRLAEQPALTVLNLIRMGTKLLFQLGNRLVTFSAARATVALKLAVWFLLLRLVIACSFKAEDPRRAENVTYRQVKSVQATESTSDLSDFSRT